MATRKPSTEKKLESVLAEVIFVPSPPQRQVKAAFWAKLAESPVADAGNITLAVAQDLTNDTRLQKWWRVEGFQDWFTNKTEWKQRLAYLADLSLDTAESILTDPNAQASAKVRLIEILARLANKEPARSKEIKYLDKDVQNMDLAQLESLFDQHGLKLLPKEG